MARAIRILAVLFLLSFSRCTSVPDVPNKPHEILNIGQDNNKRVFYGLIIALHELHYEFELVDDVNQTILTEAKHEGEDWWQIRVVVDQSNCVMMIDNSNRLQKGFLPKNIHDHLQEVRARLPKIFQRLELQQEAEQIMKGV